MSKLPVKDIIEWDILNWSKLLGLWQPVLNKLDKDARILVIGERNGGLSLWLALNGFKVICTDRMEVTAQAKEIHKKYGIAHLITYSSFDIVNGSIQENSYDVIAAKSVIGGLKENPSDKATRTFDVQKKAVNNIHKMLKPGGYFLSAENMPGNIILQSYRKNKGKDKAWRYLSIADIHELFTPFSRIRLHTFGLIPTNFPGSFLNKASYFINSMISPLAPQRTHYIAFTLAEK